MSVVLRQKERNRCWIVVGFTCCLALSLCYYLKNRDMILSLPYFYRVPSSGSDVVEHHVAQIRLHSQQKLYSYKDLRRVLMFNSAESFENWWVGGEKQDALNVLKWFKVLMVTSPQGKVDCLAFEAALEGTKNTKARPSFSKILSVVLQMIALPPSTSKIELEQLHLDDVGIKDFVFPVTAFLRLEHISLTGNCLKSIDPYPFQPLTNLKILDLRYNQLQSFYFTDMSLNGLELLDISHNPIRRLANVKLGSLESGVTQTIIAMKNTSLVDISFCDDAEPPQSPQIWKNSTGECYPAIYIGTGHSITCTCNILAMERCVIGSKCIMATANLDSCPNDYRSYMCNKRIVGQQAELDATISLRKLLSDSVKLPDKGVEKEVDEFIEYLPPRYIAALVVCLVLAVILCIAGFCIYRTTREPGEVGDRKGTGRDVIMSPVGTDGGSRRGSRLPGLSKKQPLRM